MRIDTLLHPKKKQKQNNKNLDCKDSRCSRGALPSCRQASVSLFFFSALFSTLLAASPEINFHRGFIDWVGLPRRWQVQCFSSRSYFSRFLFLAVVVVIVVVVNFTSSWHQWPEFQALHRTSMQIIFYFFAFQNILLFATC